MDVQIFISYSHVDEKYKDQLESHLSLMRQNGEIISWSDRQIIAGEEWEQEISQNLELASIIPYVD